MYPNMFVLSFQSPVCWEWGKSISWRSYLNPCFFCLRSVAKVSCFSALGERVGPHPLSYPFVCGWTRASLVPLWKSGSPCQPGPYWSDSPGPGSLGNDWNWNKCSLLFLGHRLSILTSCSSSFSLKSHLSKSKCWSREIWLLS